MQGQLTGKDRLVLVLYASLLFGVSLWGGRALSMHEARLPQTSREMYSAGEWLVPTLGGRPWLERPPLPHWITIGIGHCVGGLETETAVRIAPALMGVLTVLLVAWMAALWFGRAVGMLSGLLLATTLQFTRYVWLAEEEAFLSAVVAAGVVLFVRSEFGSGEERGSIAFLGRRPWPVVLFFVVIGLSNMVKGLFFGAAMTLLPIGAYLLWNRDWRGIRRYLWLWGGLLAGALALAWPLYANSIDPTARSIWFQDIGGRSAGALVPKPIYYYLLQLPWEIAPWTPFALGGLWVLRRNALGGRATPERFLWCWALMPLLFLSAVKGKHHHYLVPSLAPWAILGAVGVTRWWQWLAGQARWLRSGLLPAILGLIGAVVMFALRDRIPGTETAVVSVAVAIPFVALLLNWCVMRPSPRAAAGWSFGVLLVLFAFGHVYAGTLADKYRLDAAFLKRVRAEVPASSPLFVNGRGEGLKRFHDLFYLDASAQQLLDLSFLRDERITQPEVFVVCRAGEQEALGEYGRPELMFKSEYERHPAGPKALFRLRFHEDLKRYPDEVEVSALETFLGYPVPRLGE